MCAIPVLDSPVCVREASYALHGGAPQAKDGTSPDYSAGGHIVKLRYCGLEDDGHVTYRWIIGALLRDEDDAKIRRSCGTNHLS